MAVEDITQRDVVVTFTAHFASYNPGDVACFLEGEAQRLTELGVVGEPTPPANVDAPAIAQNGHQLGCTDGNWDGVPTAYHHQWQLDGTDAGINSNIYWCADGDVGKTATCIVTATNVFGSTAAPPSNAVVIEGF